MTLPPKGINGSRRRDIKMFGFQAQVTGVIGGPRKEPVKVFPLIYGSDPLNKTVWTCKRRTLRPVQTFLPAGMRVRFAASVVPDELPAAIVSARVLVVPDPVALLWHTEQTRLSVNVETARGKQVDSRKTGRVRGWGTCCPWWPIQFASPLM